MLVCFLWFQNFTINTQCDDWPCLIFYPGIKGFENIQELFIRLQNFTFCDETDISNETLFSFMEAAIFLTDKTQTMTFMFPAKVHYILNIPLRDY